MHTAMTLRERYTEVMDRVARAARRAGRSPSDILVVAVTKYAEPDQIRDLMAIGHRDFGENKVQQLVQRSAMVGEYADRGRRFREAGATDLLFSPGVAAAARWHMIGRLQRNKVKKCAETARLIHSVDSLRLAEEIQTVALKREQPVDILLQINCSGEPSKAGLAIPAAPHVADLLGTMINVRLRGVMTMAPHGASEPESRAVFERCRDCFEEMKRMGVGEDQHYENAGPGGFNILSMGMSGDFEAAIAEGANVVRIGSALFGEPAPDMDVGDDPEERDDD